MKLDYNSNSESDSDSESEESQLNKLGISKSDLVKIDANTKDCCVHWYYPTNKNVYSYNMKKHIWMEDNGKLKEFLEDEIEQIEKNLKKSSKSKKKLESEPDENTNTDKKKVKKNKSTSQQVSTYKTKAKSNAKYIEESDGLEDSEDLERELAGK